MNRVAIISDIHRTFPPSRRRRPGSCQPLQLVDSHEAMKLAFERAVGADGFYGLRQ